MIDTLSLLTFLEFFTNEAGFHGSDPGFTKMAVTFGEFFWRMYRLVRMCNKALGRCYL
jgi:hypothetical protein